MCMPGLAALAREAGWLRQDAPIDEALSRRARTLAIEAGSVLEGAGLARVDFLLDRRAASGVNACESMPQ